MSTSENSTENEIGGGISHRPHISCPYPQQRYRADFEKPPSDVDSEPSIINESSIDE